MNDPGQYLVHLTSRGPKVFGDDGAVGSFKCYTTQPMKDINRFGLLHYSIPKMLDHVQDNNRKFTVRLKFAHETMVDVPVYLPKLDYNDMYVTHPYDRSRISKKKDKLSGISSRLKWAVMFDEVLQSTINWALMEAADRFYALGGAASISEKMCARISCIVRHSTKTNTLGLTFGYRGTNVIPANDIGNPTTQAFTDGTRTLSGCPFPTINQNVVNGNGVIAANASALYARTGPNGQTRIDDPAHDIGGWLPGPIDEVVLTGVELRDLSGRLQLMLGAPGPNIAHSISHPTSHVETRGRIRLVNYLSIHAGTKAGANPSSGLFGMEMSIPPNLDPPSLLYLQLQVPGTKTRVLGQNDERGGWAIPTPPNGYLSKYQNLEKAQAYGLNHCRYMPIIKSQVGDAWLATSRLYYNNFGNVVQVPPAQNNSVDGVGYNYDPIPVGADSLVGGTVNIVGGAAVDVLQIDNYNGNHAVRGSRMIRFQNAEHKRPRADDMVTRGTQAFGVGRLRQPAVFTSSMIDPNWVYTSTVENTIQTFDVQLLWGDTCEAVTDVAGHPVQFSIIASP